jgi:hypothetical protein
MYEQALGNLFIPAIGYLLLQQRKALLLNRRFADVSCDPNETGSSS